MPAISQQLTKILTEDSTKVLEKKSASKIIEKVSVKTQEVAYKALDHAKLSNIVKNTSQQVVQKETESIAGRLMQTPARIFDFATGHNRVNINTLHHVTGDSPAKWADEFLKNPSSISPISSNIDKQGDIIIGKPFPGGPDIGILLKNRQDIKLPNGVQSTILDIQYSGAFVGPGKITITQNGAGKMTVQDEWLNLENKSFLPSLAAENGHPVIAGLGFKGIGSKAIGETPSVVADATGMMFNLSLKVMTFPFSLFK